MSREHKKENSSWGLERRRVFLAGILVFTQGCSVLEGANGTVFDVASTSTTARKITPTVEISSTSTSEFTQTNTPTPSPALTQTPTITSTTMPEYLQVIPQSDGVGLIGTHLLNESDILDSAFYEPSHEVLNEYKFRNQNGDLLDYGHFRSIIVDNKIRRIYLHARFRGIVEGIPDTTGLGGSKYFLIEMPYDNGDRQFILGFLPNQIPAPTNVYLVGDSVEKVYMKIMTYADILKVVKEMPDGVSIIVGLQTNSSYDDEYEAARNEKIVSALIEGNLISTSYLFGMNINDYYLPEDLVNKQH
jgi:hypothetical protein